MLKDLKVSKSMGDVQRILVVDDDRANIRLVVESLRGLGCQMDTASDGVQALEKVRSEPPDLLLLDVMMPKLNGLEVCRIVKSQAEESFIPIILLTVKGDIDSKVIGLKLGADDYVSKPYNPLELRARVISMLRIKNLQDKLIAKRRELERLCVTDELTGLLNHRAMQQRLRDEYARAQRYNEPLSVIMVDIDHFKDVNDRHGHIFGDHVLSSIGRLMVGCVRSIDVIARYGGEEFLVILPGTHVSGGMVAAKRIWQGVGHETFTDGKQRHSLTVSLGVSFFPNKNVSKVEDLVALADEALYQAKREGRNRICVL